MLLRALLAVDIPSVPDTENRLERLLREKGFRPDRVQDGEAIWEPLSREDHDLVLVDAAQAAELMESARQLPSPPAVVALTREDDPEQRAELVSAGCRAVLGLGLADRTLAETLFALAKRRNEELLTHLGAQRRQKRSKLSDFVSAGPSMIRLVDLAERVARTDSALLILGETGVGKERLARSIHFESDRSRGPFIPVNCGALPEGLLESELFGHEQGAFTGASRARRGYFQLAQGGTIFLDEIGEMPLHLQVKLLRVLEGRQIQRVGGEHPIEIDVRIMAATNRELKTEMETQTFRADLYYRLAVITLTIPPLRERREDVPELAQKFLHNLRRQLGGKAIRFHPAALQALVHYDWPGNVRELINVIERAVLVAPGPEIGPSDLRLEGLETAEGESRPKEAAQGGGSQDGWAGLSLSAAREQWTAAFERSYLARLLETTGGRIGETARRAGVNERTLYNMMRRHGLRKEDFRSRIAMAGHGVTGGRVG
ncbi:MAG TPA: sigma-54 dependent transcriptional regulator [Vicinamibacteria bacterium]|jgi:DNA-binding NtrC family response regulator